MIVKIKFFATMRFMVSDEIIFDAKRTFGIMERLTQNQTMKDGIATIFNHQPNKDLDSKLEWCLLTFTVAIHVHYHKTKD